MELMKRDNLCWVALVQIDLLERRVELNLACYCRDLAASIGCARLFLVVDDHSIFGGTSKLFI